MPAPWPAPDAESSRRSFEHASAGTAGAVKLALAHQDGVLTASGTYLSKNPKGSSGEFKSWSGWARLMRNHPELESLSLIALVRAPELAAFHAHVAGHPIQAARRHDRRHDPGTSPTLDEHATAPPRRN